MASEALTEPIEELPERVAPELRPLLVALHDGTVERSADGGATWTVRLIP